MDFAEPFIGHMFLVVVNAHSKWLDVHIMQSITAEKTIEKLQYIFDTHGLPKQIVITMVHHLLVRNLNNLSPGMTSYTHSLLHTILPQMDWQRGQSKHSNKALEKCRKVQ